jgi:hypothetical protein
MAQRVEATRRDQLGRARDEPAQLAGVAVAIGLGTRGRSLCAAQRDRELDRAS